MLHIAGDFNMNLLDYEKCKKLHEVLNLIHESSMIPTINKPTRVTRQSANAIDHILTNCFVNFDFKLAIFKSDISDYFPISFFLPMTNELSKTEPIYIHNVCYKNPNVCCKNFLKKLMSLYDEYFPIKIIKLKTTKGIKVLG